MHYISHTVQVILTHSESQAFYYVPTAQLIHFIHEPASSTLLKLVGGCTPKPLLSYPTNVHPHLASSTSQHSIEVIYTVYWNTHP